MPLRHLILLLTCVIAAAGLTVFLIQGLLTPAEAFIGGGLVALAMFIRVLVLRK